MALALLPRHLEGGLNTLAGLDDAEARPVVRWGRIRSRINPHSHGRALPRAPPGPGRRRGCAPAGWAEPDGRDCCGTWSRDAEAPPTAAAYDLSDIPPPLRRAGCHRSTALKAHWQSIVSPDHGSRG